MGSIVQDFRYAIRMARRRPFVTSTIVLTLGLAIGANTAIFRVFNATFLRPLPFEDEARLVRIYVTPETGGARISPRGEVLEELEQNATSFSGIVGQLYADMTLTTDAGPEQMSGIRVTPGWAATLGVQPILGRSFSEEEEQAGSGSDAVLISDAVWKNRFGGSHDVLGETVRIDGRTRTIVGVMPPGLRYPYFAQFWVPARIHDDRDSTWSYNIQARLAPGVSLQQARAELRRFGPWLHSMSRYDGMTIIAVPVREVLMNDQGKVIVGLLGFVGFLLLMASVNIANLLLAQSISRRREFAVRAAIGATGRRQAQQMITEGVALSLAGGVVGLVVSGVANSLLVVMVPRDLTYVVDRLPLDGRVAIFSLAISVAAAILFASLPAIRMVMRDPRGSLAAASRSTTDRGVNRTGRILVVAEIALALVLLTGAEVMTRDVRNRRDLDLGYDTSRILTLNASLTGERYATGERRDAFLREATERMRAVPGVSSLGTVNSFPAEGQGTWLATVAARDAVNPTDEPIVAHYRIVTGDLFDAMRLRLLEGRAISRADIASANPVVVVSRSLATRLWSNVDPIGKQIQDTRRENAPWLTVVGIVDDLHEFYADTNRALWTPWTLFAGTPMGGEVVFVVRTSIDAPETLAPQLRDAIWSIDPELPVFDIATAEALYQSSIGDRRSGSLLAMLFAAIGLAIAMIGVYGAMAFSVGQRLRELALRMAIGADRERILRDLIGQSAILVGAGLGLGVVGSVALSRWLASSVTDGTRFDPVASATIAVLLAITALVACWIPARKATAIDPATTLRAE